MTSSAGKAGETHSPENSSVSSACLENQIQTQQSAHHIGCLSAAQMIKITLSEVSEYVLQKQSKM